MPIWQASGDPTSTLGVDAPETRPSKESRPDLVISDVRMPGMDGFELTAAIRADPELHDAKVVLLTCLSDDASRRKGKLVGASAFLTKPVSVENLRATVSSVLGLRDPSRPTAASATSPRPTSD